LLPLCKDADIVFTDRSDASIIFGTDNLEKIEDDKKVEIAFPESKEIEDKITEYALELDDYQVQSCARAQDYIKIFMRANALLNGRKKVTMSDLLLYDLVHALFLNSMRELRNCRLSLLLRLTVPSYLLGCAYPFA